MARLNMLPVAALMASLMLPEIAASEMVGHEKPERDKHSAWHETFRSNVRTIALVPLKMPRMPHRDAVQADFVKLLTAELEANGVAVVPPEVYDGLWNEKMYEIGGIYDPITGKLLQDNYDAVFEYTRTGILTDYPADAYLYPEIVIEQVRYTGSVASWNAVRERADVKGGRGLFTQYSSGHGTIAALSLKVTIRDGNGAELYSNVGGIQLTEKFGKQGLSQIDTEKLLVSKARNRAAVHLALRGSLYDFKQLSKDIRFYNKQRVRQ